MGRKVTLGQNQNSSRPKRFKLMERVSNNIKLTLSCNTVHEFVKLINCVDFYTMNLTHEVCHTIFTFFNFKSRDGKAVSGC